MRQNLLIGIAIISYFSIVLTTASPFQNNSLFDERVGLFSTISTIQPVYATAEDGGGDESEESGGGDESEESGGGDESEESGGGDESEESGGGDESEESGGGDSNEDIDESDNSDAGEGTVGATGAASSGSPTEEDASSFFGGGGASSGTGEGTPTTTPEQSGGTGEGTPTTTPEQSGGTSGATGAASSGSPTEDDAASFFGGGGASSGTGEGTPTTTTTPEQSEGTGGATGAAGSGSPIEDDAASFFGGGGASSGTGEGTPTTTTTPEQSEGTGGATGAAGSGSPLEVDPSSSFRSESTSLPGLAEGESSGAQGLTGTPGSTDTNPIGDATKDTADVNGKATTLATTTGGGVEDKVKAAAAAKDVVTNLEAQLNNLKNAEAVATPAVKSQLQGQITQLQATLDGAKIDAANKDAAAKSTTTTPATTTTGGGGGKTTTPATTTTGGGVEDKVKAAAAAKDVVTNLEAQLNNLKNAEAVATPAVKSQLQGQITQLQATLDGAKIDAANKDAAAKSTTTTPATTTTGGGGGKTTTPATTTTGGGVEDKVKAAAAAKDVVTNLEAQLNNLKNAEAVATPAVKSQLQGQITQLQATLDGAKIDAANKDAAAKSTTTTPATTTTGGGGGKTTTPATTTTGGGVEDKVKAAAAAKDVVTNLEAAVEVLKQKVNAAAPADKDLLNQEIAKLQPALDAAKVDAANKDAAAKSATTTPATTTTGGGGGKTTTPATTTTGGGGTTTTPPATTTGEKGTQLADKVKVKEVVKVINKNKVIIRDSDNDEKEIIIVGDKNTCPTQTETVPLNGQLNPKGIRLLADFDTCRISDGSVTLNMPNTDNIKLALLFVDKSGTNDAGVLVKPVKIQDLSTNQALFTVEIDGNMNGLNPMTGQTTSISKINGLALFNDGNEPIQLNSGNMAALTATFTK